MPPKSKRGKQGKRSGGFGSMSARQSKIVTFTTREIPFRITQATSGTGGITSVTSSTSSSNVNSVAIDPFSIGGRTLTIAQLFTKYRFRKVTMRYIPDTSYSGVVESISGPTTTPSYGSRVFAWGVNRDPALSTLSYSQLVQMGGVVGNTNRSSRLVFINNDSSWFFTSTTAASPTTIDLRMAAPLQLRFAYGTASTTAIGSYGQLVFDIEFQVQGDIPPSAPLGLALSAPTTESETERKEKEPEEKQGSALPLKSASTWF